MYYKKLKAICCTLILSLFFGPALAIDLNSISKMTEVYPPYNYSEGGAIKGIAVDLLIAASYKINQAVKRQDIHVVPWARGYRSALNDTNILLFSTTRTKEREELFKWAGPIAKTRIVLFAKKSNKIRITSADDIKNYSIGAVRDDVGQQLIEGLGVAKSAIQLSNKANSLIKKLDAGRIELIAYEENVARWFIKSNGLKNENYETVYVLKEGELYFSFSKDVSDAVIQTLQKGIDEVKKSPGKIGKTLYEDILSEYL